MNVVECIVAKRDGKALSTDQIHRLIDGYASGRIPDYQMSAWAMAVFFRGLVDGEIVALTRAMLHSGNILQWPERLSPIVDKHSTGGVGDKTSVILAPLLACAGLYVPMISGRGLGATGGTLDKLEAIPGFRTDLSTDELQRIVESVGCAITGATPTIAPADRKLYALRDVTGTVPSRGLITASILSKKLSAGLQGLVLDVKWGSGAFMKKLDEAKELATTLADVARRMNLPTVALVTDMNQPLGQMIGNAVEVDECVDVLKGDGPEDVRVVTVELSAEAMVLSGRSPSLEAAREELGRILDSGQALEKLREMVAAQGGDLDAPRPRARSHTWPAPQAGFVERVDTEALGWVVIHLGGGRSELGQPVDHSVGLKMLKRRGDEVTTGEPLIEVFSNSPLSPEIQQMLSSAVRIGLRPDELPLFAHRLDNRTPSVSANSTDQVPTAAR